MLRRLARNQTIQLESSGLWRMYSAFAAAENKLVYRAFTLGDTLRRSEWAEVLGANETALWERSALLLSTGNGLRSAFRVVAIGGRRFVADAFAGQERFADRVHIGKDTVTLLESLQQHVARTKRHLDVGTGSGALLLAPSGGHSELVGVDINRRAVEVARFNAALNNRACTVLAGDIFEVESIGRFDLVTWNLPFHFMPPDQRASNVDGDGGEMGIELTLRFVDRLPQLLADSGSALLLTSSPTMLDGSEGLVRALEERAKRLAMDFRITTLHALWSSAWRGFHRERGVRRIDNVVLEIRRGRGGVERIAAPLAQRVIDWAQGARNRLRV